MVVVTRRTLSTGYQVAQSVHAAFGFAVKYPKLVEVWDKISKYLVCVSAKDEDELKKLALKCEARGLRFFVFKEPDLDNQVTAIAIEPSEMTQKLISNYPLTLKAIHNANT